MLPARAAAEVFLKDVGGGRGMLSTVHAIWNGATQVAEWRVLAGPDAGSLTAVATVPWNGLDTTIPVNVTAPMFAVEALDSHGHSIGESQPVGG